jgi:hypothetical protein
MTLPENGVVPCRDCGRAISFTALTCHHCGSREPGGPDVFSHNEIRQRVIEARNDHTLVSKRRDRPYQAGRSKHWIKIKNRHHAAMSRVMASFK